MKSGQPTAAPTPLSDRCVTRAEAAVFLSVATTTLAAWATEGCGPKFIKLAAGRSGGVRYRVSELERFAADPGRYGPRKVEAFRKPSRGA